MKRVVEKFIILTLLALASTCVGKLMYFRASYWHHDDRMLEKEQKEYLKRGAWCLGCLRTMITARAMAKARILLMKTRNWESLNCPLLPSESSYLVVMIFSWRYPQVA